MATSGFAIGGVSPLGWLVAESTGGVSPLAWIQPATVIIDEALSDYGIIWAAASHPHAVFPTSFDELITATNATRMVVGN
jgi:prolyl-tRNA editing enzyme YbaK/EbsC (Cys-tRNA(Pro) deacylase)